MLGRRDLLSKICMILGMGFEKSQIVAEYDEWKCYSSLSPESTHYMEEEEEEVYLD